MGNILLRYAQNAKYSPAWGVMKSEGITVNKNQRNAFWAIFVGFCITAGAAIYPQGAFENLDVGGALILATSCFGVALLIWRFIKSNPDAFRNDSNDKPNS